MPRAPSHKREARLAVVEDLLAQGLTRTAIIERLTEGYGIRRRMAELDFNEASRRWRREMQQGGGGLDKLRLQRIFLAFRRIDRLFYRAMKKGDLKTAVNLLIHESNLLGPFPEPPPEAPAASATAEAEVVSDLPVVSPDRCFSETCAEKPREDARQQQSGDTTDLPDNGRESRRPGRVIEGRGRERDAAGRTTNFVR